MAKHTLFLCLLIIASGLPVQCQEDVLEGLALPEEYEDYDQSNVEEDEHLVTEVQEPPKFNVGPQVFTALVGETVHMPCTSDKNQTEVLLVEKESIRKPNEKAVLMAGVVLLVKSNRYSMDNQIFTINNIHADDAANYACFYQFNGVRINVTHTLIVNYEPSIRNKQKTIDASMGDTATLECRAAGFPRPTITWTKQEGSIPEEGIVNEGTTLTFTNIDRHAAGTYQCTASNGVGNPATATRELIVTHAPEIQTENEMIYTGTGDRAELVCIVHAFPAAEVEWLHEGSPVDSDTRAEVHDGGHRHLLTLEPITEDHFGRYKCQAKNSLGSDSKEIFLTDAPSKPSLTSDPQSGEEESHTITWTTNSYYPITEYRLLYRKAKANDSTDEPGEWHEVKAVPKDQKASSRENVLRSFRHTLTGLDRASDYEGNLSLRNTAKQAEEISFWFSTRKETARQQQTSGARRPLLAAVVPCLLLLVAFLPC